VCLTEWAELLFIRRFSFLTQPDVPEADFWTTSEDVLDVARESIFNCGKI